LESTQLITVLSHLLKHQPIKEKMQGVKRKNQEHTNYPCSPFLKGYV